MKSLAEEFKKPWAERDLEWIAANQDAAIAYHGLPPLPEGAVLGGPGERSVMDGPQRMPWNCRISDNEWERDPGFCGSEPSFFYAYDRDRPPFRKDPPPETWPEPPEGCKWGRNGWGLEGPFNPGSKFYFAGEWRKTHPWGEGTECFYLEAVPLPTETVPFDGPEDFQCEKWPVVKSPDGTVSVMSYANLSGFYHNSGLHFVEWEQACKGGWLYSDSVKGPWLPFSKPAPGKHA